MDNWMDDGWLAVPSGEFRDLGTCPVAYETGDRYVLRETVFGGWQVIDPARRRWDVTGPGTGYRLIEMLRRGARS